MTALCLNNGTSSVKAGTALAAVITTTYIQNQLITTGYPWLIAAAAALEIVPFAVTAFCSTDPPAIPTFTLQDYLAMFNVADPVNNPVAMKKLQDLMLHLIWFDFCQCDANPQPVLPAPQTAPTGVPAQGPTGGSVGVCYSPPGDTIFNLPISIQQTQTQPGFPINATSSKVTITRTGAAGNQVDAGFVSFVSPGGTDVLITQSWALFGGVQSAVVNIPVAGGADAIRFQVNQDPGGSGQIRFHVDFYCASGSGSSSSPTTSTPDPTLVAIMTQILQAVTLIQRQIVPFAYVPGTSHLNLTGSGQFAVQGILGLAIGMNSIPQGIGSAPGDPTEYFDTGFITLGTADGFSESFRIHHNPTLKLDINPSYTLVGYTLPPGVNISVTELKREP